jgi:DNA transformation protein and related proteins
MAKSNAFVQYITEEALGHIPGITVRAMFGGFGVYKDGIIFGLIDDDRLYFKVDDSNRQDFEEKGTKPFIYIHKGKEMTMGYWEVPEVVLEDRDVVSEWVEKAVTVSVNAKKGKQKT